MKDFNGLTKKEQKTLKKAQEELKKIPLILCTTCNYCAKKYVCSTLRSEMSWRKLQQNFWGKLL